MLNPLILGLPVRVILFLAPLCPICQDMTFDLRGLEAEFDDPRVEFIGVFPNSSTRQEQMEAFAGRYGIEMTLVRDTANWAEALGARWTPEAFILDVQDSILYQGRINDRYFAPGRRKSKTRNRDLRNALLDIMAGQPVTVPLTEAVGCPIEGVKVMPSKN
jgi:hypothetical protein